MDVIINFSESLIGSGVTAFAIVFITAFFDTLFLVGMILYGTLIMAAAVFAVSSGHASILEIWGAAFLGALIAENINYYLGYVFGNAIMKRLRNHRIRNGVEGSHKFLEKYGLVSMIIGRFFAITRSNMSFVFGISGIKYKVYALSVGFSLFVWVTVWCVVLWYFVR